MRPLLRRSKAGLKAGVSIFALIGTMPPFTWTDEPTAPTLEG